MTVSFRWEQDGAGGDNGTVDFVFPASGKTVTVPMYSFKGAHELHCAIQAELVASRRAERFLVLDEVAEALENLK